MEEIPVVVGLVNDSRYEKINADTLEKLSKSGLKNNIDYSIFGLHPSFSEYYPHPIFKLSNRNPWGFRPETFFGEEAIDFFISRLNKQLNAI